MTIIDTKGNWHCDYPHRVFETIDSMKHDKDKTTKSYFKCQFISLSDGAYIVRHWMGQSMVEKYLMKENIKEIRH